MRQWRTCKVEDVRLGNIVSTHGVTDEVTGKRPSGMAGNTSIFLDLRENGTVEMYQDQFVEVYR